MNKVILMGRLTKDPDTRYNGENPISRFTLAVDRRVAKEKDKEADFISCVAFTKKAEFCEKYLHQGSKVVLSGRIQTGSYTNKDNQKVHTTDVIVEDIEFAESKNADSNKPEQKTDAEPGAGFMNIPDNVEAEGLPFN